MRPCTLSLLAATLLVGAMAAACAGERPRAATVYDWSGFYAGGNFGYGWDRDTGGLFDQFSDPGDGVAEYFSSGGNGLPGTRPRGISGGLQVGYN